jgi:hypothetical protein
MKNTSPHCTPIPFELYEHVANVLSNAAIRASRSPHSLTETSPSSEGTGHSVRTPESAALMQHAHDYGYSNADSLNSMGMLTKVRRLSFAQRLIDRL